MTINLPQLQENLECIFIQSIRLTYVSAQDSAVAPVSSGDLGLLLDLDRDLDPLFDLGVWLLERDLDLDLERDLEADLDLLLRGVRVLERERDLDRERE